MTSRGLSETPKFFSIPRIAEALSVSTRTVRRWIKRRELVAHRLGTAVRISERDLRALEVDDSLRPITYDLIRAYRNEGFDWPPRWDKGTSRLHSPARPGLDTLRERPSV